MKVFISMPMRDKTKEQIMQDFKSAEQVIKRRHNNVQIVNSYAGLSHNPVFRLGEAIMQLSMAGMCYFCEGWHKDRRCKIEHLVCEEYGIKKEYYGS